MKKAFVHFAQGFEEIEALTIVDVLRRAEIPTEMVSVTGQRQVTGAHGIKITADIVFEDVNYEESAMVILPGGMPGSKNLLDHAGLAEVIKKKAAASEPLAAICAAPMVFGELGVLQGKEAVCYPGFESHLKGATVKDDLSLRSGNVITGRGPGAALNFALEIVEVLKGKDAANALAHGMIVKTWN
ncbi:MAG: DJ-1/PfpI family protein [Bacteroidales bacterium]|nr:DJ-1/PfpI family protein [Bacteroidales bacterium]MBN2821272.1 DJ-1/PfpI family protein [Bacteroidales bacterium]